MAMVAATDDKVGHPPLELLFTTDEETGLTGSEEAEYRWLVDPLDGTKEFVNRNDEFTVNIALIRDFEPAFGVVHVPVSGDTYSGIVGSGATRRPAAGDRAGGRRVRGAVPRG